MSAPTAIITTLMININFYAQYCEPDYDSKYNYTIISCVRTTRGFAKIHDS